MSSSGTESERPKAHPNEHISDVMRALKRNDHRDEALKVYLKAARWISMGIHPYANLTSVLFTGLSCCNEEDDDVEQLSEIDAEEELRLFHALLGLTPSFEEVLQACASHKRALRNLVRMLEDASHSARNDDVAKTNAFITDYIIQQEVYFEFYDREECPMPERTNYQDRGWNHPQYAALLYPMCSIDHMRSDDMINVMHDCENGIIEISESEWPAFLYPPETNSDVDDDLEGLFRSCLLLKVYRQIFTGPRSAKQPNQKKGRAPKAKQHNLTKVTPRTIAYASVITRIVLRGRGWATEDGQFEYEVFYQNIINLFEDLDNAEWAEDTLEWWNEQVPGLPRSTASLPKKRKSTTTNIKGRILDPVARAKAQREARAAAASTTSSATNRTSTTTAITTSTSTATATSTTTATSARVDSGSANCETGNPGPRQASQRPSTHPLRMQACTTNSMAPSSRGQSTVSASREFNDGGQSDDSSDLSEVPPDEDQSSEVQHTHGVKPTTRKRKTPEKARSEAPKKANKRRK